MSRSMSRSNDCLGDKEGFGEKKGEKTLFLEYVRLTAEEHRKLIDTFGEQGAADRIQELNDGIGSKGYKYHSHYHTILSWDRKHSKEKTHGKTRRDPEPNRTSKYGITVSNE